MTWTPERRGRLASLADLLIPAGDELPSASAAGVSAEPLDQILAGRDELAEDLQRALDHAGDPATVDELEKALAPEEFQALTTVVSGAYFLDPGVRAHLGYDGPRPIPTHDEQPTDELLAPVRDRGLIYRKA